LGLAGELWDYMQIKEIAEGEIDDFFSMDHGVGKKSLSSWKAVLYGF